MNPHRFIKQALNILITIGILYYIQVFITSEIFMSEKPGWHTTIYQKQDLFLFLLFMLLVCTRVVYFIFHKKTTMSL
jgi:hypothetical protein